MYFDLVDAASAPEAAGAAAAGAAGTAAAGTGDATAAAGAVTAGAAGGVPIAGATAGTDAVADAAAVKYYCALNFNVGGTIKKNATVERVAEDGPLSPGAFQCARECNKAGTDCVAFGVVQGTSCYLMGSVGACCRELGAAGGGCGVHSGSGGRWQSPLCVGGRVLDDVCISCVCGQACSGGSG